MKYIFLICFSFFIISCGKEKVVILPEINYSSITEIKDVSAAYLFYDETQPDSIELNRKNLISSTNWLVNVDKRLTLGQVIPKIKFLQDKKNNSSHKKEHTKNYFTCNNISQKKLGFIEFTNLTYIQDTDDNSHLQDSKNIIPLNFNSKGDIIILNRNTAPFIFKTNKENLLKTLKKIDSTHFTLVFRFHKDLSFQEYISYKSFLNTEITKAKISKKEFIDN